MCALKVDSKPPVSKGAFHCRLDGVRLVKSVVFDSKNGNLFVVYNGPADSRRSSSDHNKSRLGVWSVKDSAVSKSHTLVDIQDDLEPTNMVIVDVASKQSLVLRTECTDEVQLWETNFLSGGKDLVKPIDVSKIDNSPLLITSWKNLLFVIAYDQSSVLLHVYKNLEYQSKMSAIPVKSQDLFKCSYSFSDEYFVILILMEKPSPQDGIYAYRWSPEKLSIGDLILGPVEGCIIGSHAQLNPYHIMTNIPIGDDEYAKAEDYANRHRVAIYNIQEKSVSRFLLQDNALSETIALIMELPGKALVVLGRGSVFELN